MTLHIDGDYDSITAAIASYFDGLAGKLQESGFPTKIVGPFGDQGVEYIADDGIWASISASLPEGVLVEIEDYEAGELLGFRVRLAASCKAVETEDGDYEVDLYAPDAISIIDADGNDLDDVEAGQPRFAELMQVIIDANS